MTETLLNMRILSVNETVMTWKINKTEPLRTVAKFNTQMAENEGNIKGVMDIFYSSRGIIFIDTVREFSKLGENNIEKEATSNVKHFGLLLSNQAKDLEVTCNNETQVKIIKLWLKLYSRKYNSSIGW